MQILNSLEELTAVEEGFLKFLFDNFNKNRFLCHPVANVLFFPDMGERNSNNCLKLKVAHTFLYSQDGVNWSHLYNDMFSTLESGRAFYIADFKLRVVLPVEYYIVEDIINFLETEIDNVITVQTDKWKDTSLGELKFITESDLR